MIKNLNISNFSKKSSQIFHFITEEKWKNLKKEYKKVPENFFSAKKNEFFVHFDDHSTEFLIGLGSAENPEFEAQNVAQKFSWEFRKKINAEKTLLTISSEKDSTLAIIQGLFLGCYEFPFQSQHVFFKEKFELIIYKNDDELSSIKTKTLAICNGQFSAMDWLNKPQNHKRVSHISEFIQDISKKYKFKTKVFNRKEAEKLGLGAFLAVNQGSSQEAAFTIIEYNSSAKSAKKIGLIGKCVLFDTGGISIKPSENMHYMKSDMGGATAVLGALIAAAEQKLPHHIIAILPITDNAVSAEAYIPSDVVKAYNGKTIEILNTDAEGRLTLADALSYLSKNYKTDVMIDLATLTGSSVRMFGNTCGVVFSNNSELKNQLEAAGEITNQRLWNLPLWDVWKEDINSDVADFKNISLKPVGDCIVAAKFLEQFIEGHQNWAHLDIAGVAFGNVQYAKEKAATGYGVQLLLNFMENLK